MWEYFFGNTESESTQQEDGNELREYLIDKMQKKGDEILYQRIENTETYFYAAQRLKIAKSFDTIDPCDTTSRLLSDKLVDLVKLCPEVIKQSNEGVREQIKYITDYLAAHIFEPDPQIDAFLTLLKKMEAAGDIPLIELDPLEKIKKSYKVAAADLKTFTSIKDNIKRQDNEIASTIRGNLKKLIKDDNLTGYDLAIMNQVINVQTDLLTSFLLLDREKTAALEVLLEQLEDNMTSTVLQHGSVRKTCADALNVLHGVNAYELTKVADPNPIVSRKLQIHLENLVRGKLDMKPILTKVLHDATNYLAYNFVESPKIKTCICEKSTYVECTINKDGEKRNILRTYCRCSQPVGPSRASMPRLELSECPRAGALDPPPPCPGQKAGTPCPRP